MNPEYAQEGQQNPTQIVIHRPADISPLGLPLHRRNQEQINYPADEQQPQSEKPDDASDFLAVIKTMGPRESEKPNKISKRY